MEAVIGKQGNVFGKCLVEELSHLNWSKATRVVAGDLLTAANLDHASTSFVAERQGRKERSVILLEGEFPAGACRWIRSWRCGC